MIALMLEATVGGKPVLLLAAFNSPPNGKALVLGTDSKMKIVDLASVDVSWHYDESKGWLADFPREEA